MIAQMITWNTVTTGLLVAPPNWDTEVKVSLELPTDISKEPITLQESRRNFAASARYKLSWRAYLFTAADATELRIFLTRLRGEAVLAPLWPDQCETTAATSIGASALPTFDRPVRSGSTWIVAAPDFSLWEIVTVTSITGSAGAWSINISPTATKAWPIGTYLFPLILGRLDERPKPEWITDETLEVDLAIKENSNFTYRITTTTATLSTVGSTIPTFSTALKWDVAPNFSRPMDWTEVPDVVYEHIGFLREDQQRAYDHRNFRGQELEFYQADRDSITEIEYFWRSCRANVLRFMVPTYRGDLRFLVDAPGATTVIRCEKSQFSNPARESQPGDQFIALIDINNTVWPFQLSGTTDLANETQLNSTTTVGAFPMASTIVSHLLLARFAEATLEWSYITPYLATTRLKFMELSHEYGPTPPAPLQESAYLFIFTEVGIRTDRYTSYENTIVVPGGVYAGTYVPAPFSFDKLKVGLKLDQEKLDFKSFKFTGNPLNKMWPFGLDGILTLEIVEVNAPNPSTPAPMSRFYGDVWSVDSDYSATAVPFGNLFDRKFPRFLLSVSDNYTQFSEPTGLSPASFAIAGTINTGFPILNQQTITIDSSPGHAQAAAYFAGGWLETGTGVNLEKRGILDSVPTASVSLNLTIDRPLLKAVGAQAVTMYPGYDGSIDQCETRFANRINFGGHPYIPNINPGVKAMKPKDGSGGKK
jgi:hypothetical protein